MLMQQSGQGDPNMPWKMIRRNKAPTKAACFGWIATRTACLTQSNLQKRGFPLCSRCYLGNKEQETVEHLFLHCRVSKHCWEVFFNIMGIYLVIPQNSKSLLEIWQSQRVARAVKQIWRTYSYVHNVDYMAGKEQSMFWGEEVADI